MDARASYDEDVYLWSQQQARLLREAAAAGSNLPLDWENVAEEIESVGRSELRALESALARVIEHLLKLEYSPVSDPRAGWEDSVLEHRRRARREMKDSPSLVSKIDVEDVYAGAWVLAARGLARDGISKAEVPTDCPWTLTQLLDDDYWPANRHGLE